VAIHYQCALGNHELDAVGWRRVVGLQVFLLVEKGLVLEEVRQMAIMVRRSATTEDTRAAIIAALECLESEVFAMRTRSNGRYLAKFRQEHISSTLRGCITWLKEERGGQ